MILTPVALVSLLDAYVCVGASANIVTSGIANRAGFKITFLSWLKAGIPITIVSVATANVYMIVRYAL